MANVIKHKRGSGSDPGASDLVVGEVAIRTDTGKLFTKMDNGSVAEIAGGGSDIAINTLSSSSGTGGGSATFNGSAYRFTLSSPPSVSAQQLLVSINGVIQKPVAGTGQPSEGFSVDGNDIILGDAPATGADFFIVTFKSLGVSEPADNSVTSAKIVDGAIVNADVNASAAIAGTKISPDFGSQNISTTGRVLLGTTTEGFADADDLTIATSGNTGMTIRSGTTSYSSIFFSDATSGGGEYDGFIQYNHNTQKLTVGTGATGSSDFAIDSSGNVGIGTTSPSANLESEGNVSSTTQFSGFQGLRIQNANGAAHGVTADINFVAGTGSANRGAVIGVEYTTTASGNDLYFATNANAVASNDTPVERLRITSAGRVGIGTTSPSDNLEIASGVPTLRLTDTDGGPCYHQIKGPGNGDLRISCDVGDSSSSASEIQFDIHDSNMMVIQSTGNVGIGTTSPSAPLTFGKAVYGEPTSEDFFRIKFNDTGGINNDVGIGQPDASSLAFNTISNGTIRFYNGTDGEMMRLNASGQLGIGTTSPGYLLDVKKDSTTAYSASASPSNVIARVQNNSAQDDNHASFLLTAMNDNSAMDFWWMTIVSQSQNYNGFLAFTARTTSSASQELVRFSNNGNVTVNAGQLQATGGFLTVDAASYLISNSSIGSSSTTYYIGNQAIQTSSDRRIKENIVNTEVDALSELKKVRVVDFNWNDPSDTAVTNRNSRGKWTGCIAQEIVDVFSFAVNAPRTEDNKIDNNSEALWGMEYGQLVPVLIKAIQDLNAKVEALEAG